MNPSRRNRTRPTVGSGLHLMALFIPPDRKHSHVPPSLLASLLTLCVASARVRITSDVVCSICTSIYFVCKTYITSTNFIFYVYYKFCVASARIHIFEWRCLEGRACAEVLPLTQSPLSSAPRSQRLTRASHAAIRAFLASVVVLSR